MTVVLRTAEEILEGAAHLKASSGEIVEEEDYLIQAELRPRRGPTGGKATQETTLHMAGLTPGHFSLSLFFPKIPVFSPLSSRGNSRRNSPHSRPGSPPRQTRVFRRAGSPRFFFNFFFFRFYLEQNTKLNLSPGALGGEALCQGLHRLHTLTGEMLANAVNYCQIKHFWSFT